MPAVTDSLEIQNDLFPCQAGLLFYVIRRMVEGRKLINPVAGELTNDLAISRI